MEKLKDFLTQINMENIDTKAEILEKYMDEVLLWNEKINLTAITDREEFIQKHFIDSLLCVGSDEMKRAEYIIDVGTGGGFPGVPLAVCFPLKRFVLMDSLAKKLRVVDEICEKLGIVNVETIHGRAEDLARQEEYREQFDLCVSRAVANMSTLCEYCLPFVKTGGCFIAYKGTDCKSELGDASDAIRILGGKLARTEKSSNGNAAPDAPAGLQGIALRELPFEHTLVYVDKIKNTGKKFPRQAGTPAKQPL